MRKAERDAGTGSQRTQAGRMAGIGDYSLLKSCHLKRTWDRVVLSGYSDSPRLENFPLLSQGEFS